ncbi:hypothetical protein PVAG01_08279 [Phlyctema vagabunda]|uniref:Uncharacterized protein n=1 Tax=Phlyctema vagabunda TaxID=108571 RepID=A0ABR4P9N3_9HELO
MLVLRDPDAEEAAFQSLLYAMYGRLYMIKTVEEFAILVRLADFYCSLPVLSATVMGALLLGDFFQQRKEPRNFFANPILLALAIKIRQPVLFREFFVHVVAEGDPNILGSRDVF